MSWTDERVSLLKQLWGEGKTAAEIARQLGEGVTRNAVIGKAHRLKLSGRVSPIQQNKKVKKVEKPKAPKQESVAQKLKRAPAVEVSQMAINNGKGVSLIELNDRMCHWPNGDPNDDNFNFCGCKSVPGLPYCDSHARMAYQIATKARPLNAKDFEEKPSEENTEEADEVAVQVA